MEDNAKLSRISKRTGLTSRGSTAYHRKRAVIACQVCRARRTKCDQKKPACSFCQSIGAECVSDPPALSAFDPASVAIIERLDKLEGKFSRIAHILTARESFCQQPVSVRYTQCIRYQNLDEILKWPVFQGERLSVSYQSHISAWPPHLFRRAATGLSSGGSNGLDRVPHLLLIDRFFDHVHNRNPILDEAKTRALAKEIHARDMGWDAESCLILLVWANGALVHPLPSPALSQHELEQNQATTLFIAAEQRLGPVLISAGIVQAQCLFLAGVFLMTALRPFDAWRMFLQALVMCRTINKTLSCNAGDRVSIESIHWSAWKSERELYRELWPSPDCRSWNFEHPQQFPSLPADCEGENMRTWYFYLSEISAWRLQTYVEEEMARSAVEGHSSIEHLTEIADNLMQQAVEWENSLAPQAFVGHYNKSDDEDMLRLILRARIAYVQDLISWPFVYSLIHDGVEPVSPQAQKWAMMGLSCHLQKLLIHQVRFYYRHHGTWLMMRSCARSACILLAAARRPFSEELLPAKWRGAVEATLEMLQFWRSHLTELNEVVQCIEGLCSQL